MKNKKLLSCLLSGSIALSMVPGMGGIVMADEENPEQPEVQQDVTGPAITKFTLLNVKTDGFDFSYQAKDEEGGSGISGATVTWTDENGNSGSVNTAASNHATTEGATGKLTVQLAVYDKAQNASYYTVEIDPANTAPMAIEYGPYSKCSASKIYNDHLYLRYDGSYNWASSEAYAQRLGGHLVSLNDEYENEMINGLVSDGTTMPKKENGYGLTVQVQNIQTGITVSLTVERARITLTSIRVPVNGMMSRAARPFMSVLAVSLSRSTLRLLLQNP